MKQTFKVLFILAAFALLVLSASLLRQHSFTLFVLRNAGGRIEAFQLQLPLARQEPSVTTVKLDPDQKKQALALLRTGDSKALSSFGAGFGKFNAVCGLTSEKQEDFWPNYLGGGIRSALQGTAGGEFDDLNTFDRLYLSVSTQVPPAAPFVNNDLPIELSPRVSATVVPTVSAVPVVSPASSTGVVRVEILNGCGITNAADWVARKFQGHGITIVSTGNADHFHYAKTVIRSAVGVPVALEEAVERLGLSKDSIEEIPNPPDAMDVAVIVGRDYPRLKRHRR